MNNLIYKVTAFTDEKNGGNPAGIVLNADEFSRDQMLSIAKEIGFSETAFVMQSNVADYKVQFFTPVDEVDLCGHATVAVFNLLRDIGRIKRGDYTQETKAGILKIQVFENSIYMQQNLPRYDELIDEEEIYPCFENELQGQIMDLPIQMVSTGLKDILLPVKDLDTLLSLKPNVDRIHKISDKYNAVGIHAFCIQALDQGDVHTRNFAPRYGIDEESATGTSNGALACYLNKYLNQKFEDEFVIEQGYCMNRPSKILAKLISEGDEIKEVYIGGSAISL